MKIIIINGSYRKNGATASILNEIYSNLIKHQNVEVEIIHVADLQLNFCTGCSSCYKTGKCIFKDEIEDLSHRIKNADGIILGSSTYASNVSAQMKVVIDRGHFIMEQLLHKKYAISVVTYENYGGKNNSKILNNLLLFSGAQISGRILSKLDFNSNPLDNITLRKEIIKKSKRIYKDIQLKRNHHIQKIMHSLIFNIGIKPFVIRKYSAVVNHWNE